MGRGTDMPLPMEQWHECRERADRAAVLLLEALSALGIPQTAYGSIRPVVTHRGRVYVNVGMLREDAVSMVVDVLKRGTVTAPDGESPEGDGKHRK